MGRISIPRRYDALNLRWLRQEQQLLQPNFVGDEIGWTSEWLPGTLLYQQELNFETVTGAAGVVNADGSTVADGQVIMVIAGHTSHLDATARAMAIGLRNATNGNIAQVSASGAGSLVPQSAFFALDRPILVSEGHHLRASVLAIAAGATITLSYYYLRLRFGEPIPRH